MQRLDRDGFFWQNLTNQTVFAGVDTVLDMGFLIVTEGFRIFRVGVGGTLLICFLIILIVILLTSSATCGAKFCIRV